MIYYSVVPTALKKFRINPFLPYCHACGIKNIPALNPQHLNLKPPLSCLRHLKNSVLILSYHTVMPTALKKFRINPFLPYCNAFSIKKIPELNTKHLNLKPPLSCLRH
jgi:hypothetical protein